MDLCGVVEPLEHVARSSRLRKGAKARFPNRRGPKTASRSQARRERVNFRHFTATVAQPNGEMIVIAV